MAPRPGQRDNSQDPGSGWLETAGRFLGFLLFAGPAMLIVAGLVLLPAYKHHAQTQYGLACLQNKLDEAKQFIDGNKRLIRDLPNDEVLNIRLIMSQSSLTPINETVVYDPDMATRPPTMVNPAKLPAPPPPQGKLITLANRLENPNTKRGMVLVAVGAMLAALFLFSPSKPQQE